MGGNESAKFSSNVLFQAGFVLVYLLPILYVALIFGVAVHEILGHGLFAVLFGGEFLAFTLKADAMGYACAFLPDDASVTADIIFLMSGAIMTTMAAIILTVIALFFRKRLLLQLTLLVTSFICIMDGIPYLLWNSYNPVPPGDFGRIINLWQEAGLPLHNSIQYLFLAIGAISFVCATYYYCTAIFIRIEAFILKDGQFSKLSRFWAILVFLTVPGIAQWLLFDWNQLAPGINKLPNYVGILSVLAMSAWLYFRKPKYKITSCCYRRNYLSLAIVWLMCGSVVLLMIFKLADGVMV